MKGAFSTARQGLLEIALKEGISKALEEAFFQGLQTGQITLPIAEKTNHKVEVNMATSHAVERVSQLA